MKECFAGKGILAVVSKPANEVSEGGRAVVRQFLGMLDEVRSGDSGDEINDHFEAGLGILADHKKDPQARAVLKCLTEIESALRAFVDGVDIPESLRSKELPQAFILFWINFMFVKGDLLQFCVGMTEQ